MRRALKLLFRVDAVAAGGGRLLLERAGQWRARNHRSVAPVTPALDDTEIPTIHVVRHGFNDGNLLDIALRLAETPCSPIDYESPRARTVAIMSELLANDSAVAKPPTITMTSR